MIFFIGWSNVVVDYFGELNIKKKEIVQM